MRALVLSGGGVKGAFQLGVLSELYTRNHTKYNYISGVSTGALSGALLAHGSTLFEQQVQLETLYRIYLNIKGNGDIYKGGGNWLTKAIGIVTKGGMYDPSPLAALVRKYVMPAVLRESRTRLNVGYVDLESGAYVVADNGSNNIIDAILASAYQPIFFQLFAPLADGGLRNMTPLSECINWAKSQGAKEIEIDVIVTSPIGLLNVKPINHKNSIKVLARTFEIIMNEAFLSDIKYATKLNQFAGVDGRIVKVKVNLYAPQRNFGDGLEFDPKVIREMIAHGKVVVNERT